MAKQPGSILLNGVRYQLMLLKVESRNVRGIPMSLTLLEEEQKINIEEGMEFITAYIQEQNLEGTI